MGQPYASGSPEKGAWHSKMIEILAEFKTIKDMHNSSGSWTKVPLVLFYLKLKTP